jgi:dTDP-4-dehydrorhamnose reductase
LKILLTGKNGQVGDALASALRNTPHQVIAVGSANCDLAKPSAIRKLIQSTEPDVIINPAAYTAVDRAESEPDLAHSINAQAPEVMAAELRKTGGLLIHFSTDYVFDGMSTSPYTELDNPNPQSVYGQTKLQGEQAITASGVNHIILRTSWVFSTRGNNFLKTILRLAAKRDELEVVNDQFGTPTSARFLAQTVWRILNSKGQNGGIYHCSCDGRTSWYDYAQFALESALNLGVPIKLQPNRLTPVPATQYPSPAMRPLNSVLDCAKLENTLKIGSPHWQTEVQQTIQTLVFPLSKNPLNAKA